MAVVSVMVSGRLIWSALWLVAGRRRRGLDDVGRRRRGGGASTAATVGAGAAGGRGRAAPGMAPPFEATQAAKRSRLTTSTAIGM